MLFLASYLDRKHSKLSSPMHGLMLPLGVIGVLLLLIGKEPDLGTPSLMFGAAILVLFVAGARMRWIFAALAAAVPVVAEEALAQALPPPRALMTFLKPFKNIKGAGYQLAQAILAVGSGGWLGKGFGASQLQLMYLPPPYTDFIFPVICEELGLLGAFVVLGLFATILVRGIRIARHAPNLFGTPCSLAGVHVHDRPPSVLQHRYGHRAPAHEGHPAAVPLVRRLLAVVHFDRHRRAPPAFRARPKRPFS